MSKLQTQNIKENKADVDIHLFFFALKRLLEIKSTNYWHIFYLEKYLEVNISPMGLRVQIFLNLKILPDEFKTRWENNLSKCSQGMMQLLIKEYNKDIMQLDTEINALYFTHNALGALLKKSPLIVPFPVKILNLKPI